LNTNLPPFGEKYLAKRIRCTVDEYNVIDKTKYLI
jgi:hypothetical protein